MADPTQATLPAHTVEEWCEITREASYGSSELMSVFYRMFEVLKVARSDDVTAEMLYAPLRELRYDTAKSFRRDPERSDELHDKVYGLSIVLADTFDHLCKRLQPIDNHKQQSMPIDNQKQSTSINNKNQSTPINNQNRSTAINNRNQSIPINYHIQSTPINNQNRTTPINNHNQSISNPSLPSTPLQSTIPVALTSGLGYFVPPPSMHIPCQPSLPYPGVAIGQTFAGRVELKGSKMERLKETPLRVKNEPRTFASMEKTSICPLCQRSLHSFKELERHLRDMHESTFDKAGYDLKCVGCSTVFDSTEDIIRHMQESVNLEMVDCIDQAVIIRKAPPVPPVPAPSVTVPTYEEPSVQVPSVEEPVTIDDEPSSISVPDIDQPSTSGAAEVEESFQIGQLNDSNAARDNDDIVIRKNLECPKCEEENLRRCFHNVKSLIQHLYADHKTSFKKIGGGIRCACGNEYRSVRYIQRHHTSSACSMSIPVFFYSRSKNAADSTKLAEKARSEWSASSVSSQKSANRKRAVGRSEILACTLCEEISSSPHVLHHHLRSKHSTFPSAIGLWFECEGCAAHFTTIFQISNHQCERLKIVLCQYKQNADAEDGLQEE